MTTDHTREADDDTLVDAIIAALPLPGTNHLTSLGVALVADAVTAHVAAAVDVAVAAERESIAAAVEADDWFDPDDILHHVPDFREGVEYATKRHAHIARSTEGDGDTDD